MSIFDGLRNRLLNWLVGDSSRLQRAEEILMRRSYRTGRQRNQLKVKPSQADDNLVINFTSLVVDRSISMLFGQGISFELNEDTDDEDSREEYLKRVWDSNNQQILLHRTALLGAEDGTCYIKLIPDGVKDRKTGELLPRLVAIDPLFVTMETDPEDFETVVRYIISYVIGVNGKEVGRRQIIERIVSQTGDLQWSIADYEASDSNGTYQQIGSTQYWEYEFPPIINWQNLPSADGIYGTPDITDDVIALQDRINFVAGNISKIIRYHAHPKTWARNFGNTGTQNWGADQMIVSNASDAFVSNLEMQSDLTSSERFMLVLRQSLFDITRTVDLSSMADKLGALTNFGLRVLYLDALAKIQTKRELYGDALIELNRRLLMLGGFDGTDGGTIIWPDMLPNNEQEFTMALHGDLEKGLVDKETAARLRGYDWDTVQRRMEDQQSQEDNVGAALLRAFNRGR